MEARIKLLEPYKELFKKPKTRYYLITGSRGSAKSWHIAYFLLWLTYEPGHVILYTRFTMIASHISIIPEFIEKMDLIDSRKNFTITKTEIINNATGSRILFRGIKTSSGNQTASLKSIQGVTTYVQEEAEELTDKETFATIDLSIRHKTLPNRVIMVMNPCSKEHFIYKDFIEKKRDDTTYIHTTYLDNRHNLSPSFIEQAERTKAENYPRYQHLFLGHWIDGVEGLLWNMTLINKHRVKEAPKLKRVVVAIDPAVTANEKSDETGIVLVAQGVDDEYYVLEDNSGRYSPAEWGQVAKQTAESNNAEAYVAEGNQGHDLVASNIRHVDNKRRVKMVRATRGKFVRAEPIYGLYEEGKVHHVGHLHTLENQMVSWNPDSPYSPDRVDALVWGLTELSGRVQRNFVWA